MNAVQFKAALASVGLSQREAAEMLNVDKMTVNAWAKQGVPEHRLQAVTAFLRTLAPKEVKPEERRIFRSLDGTMEMRYKDVLKLGNGAMFWEYAHPGHPSEEPVLRRAVPCWVINRRMQWGKGLQGVVHAIYLADPRNARNIEMPADTTLEQFKAFAALQNDKDRQAAARVALAYAAHPETDQSRYDEAGEFIGQEQDQ